MDEVRWQEHLREREAQNYVSTRRWNPNPDGLGMRGEKALARFFWAEPDLRHRPEGDGGIDMEFLLNFWGGRRWRIVDIKAANKPWNLLVNSQKIRPDIIYVLGGARGKDGIDGVDCLGWEWGSDVMTYRTEYWCDNDALTHVVPRKNLRAMDELRSMYQGWWRHQGLRARPAIYGNVNGNVR